MKRKRQGGFSLLEIMAAVAILGVSMLAILNLQSGAMLTSLRAEEVTVATMLAREKIREIQLDVEKGIAKGEFPSENKELDGVFDEPFERYKWTANIKKVEIPTPQQPGGEGGASMDVVLKMFQMVSEKLADSARQIKVTIKWEELGDEKEISVATHIVKL